jgi:hypothetical protein
MLQAAVCSMTTKSVVTAHTPDGSEFADWVWVHQEPPG